MNHDQHSYRSPTSKDSESIMMINDFNSPRLSSDDGKLSLLTVSILIVYQISVQQSDSSLTRSTNQQV